MPINFDTPAWNKRFGIRAVRLLISAIFDTGPFPNAAPSLFHYTDPAGACGIISNGHIRASHIYYMNDEAEYIHAVELMLRAITEYPTCYGPIPPILLDALHRNLNSAKIVERALPIFIISFSSKQNDLSQWRAYGGGDGGFALKFSFSQISSVGYLLPCIYEPTLQYQTVFYSLIQLVAEWQSLFGRRSNAIQERNADGFVYAILRQYALIAAVIKNEGFKEEAEWRMVFYESDIKKVTIAPKGNLLTGYITPPLSPTPAHLPLDAVWIGPGRHQRLSAAATRVLLNKNNYEQVPIFVSSIPYRVIGKV